MQGNKSSKPNRATREAYGEVLVEIGKQNENLVVMDADLSGSTKTGVFAKEFPERFFNMGIAEQNLYGAAAGIALSGKAVCASTFAMFATGRAFEIIRNSIGYTSANVNICATHSGITVGEDGASHQTFEDIALMRTIPGMLVLNPCDAESAKEIIRQAVKINGPSYIRLGRAAVENIYDSEGAIRPEDITIGKAMRVRQGGDATVIATGIMVAEAVKAAEILSGEGIEISVIDMHTIKPIDEHCIFEEAKRTNRIVTAEEHSVIGGLGSAVSEVLSKKYPVRMEMVGQKDTFGESGEPQALKEKYNMTFEDIVNAVRRICDDYSQTD